jgi:hypothetical protein
MRLKDNNMSRVTDEYRKQAEQCRKNAEGSLKQEDRAFWLLLAANWLNSRRTAMKHRPRVCEMRANYM